MHHVHMNSTFSIASLVLFPTCFPFHCTKNTISNPPFFHRFTTIDCVNIFYYTNRYYHILLFTPQMLFMYSLLENFYFVPTPNAQKGGKIKVFL